MEPKTTGEMEELLRNTEWAEIFLLVQPIALVCPLCCALVYPPVGSSGVGGKEWHIRWHISGGH